MKLSAVKNLLTKMADPDKDMEDLTLALGFSSLVYFSNNFIIKKVSALNYPYKILEYKDMKCLIVETDHSIFIAFRGTETSRWLNWKRILNIIPRTFMDNLKVHGGFQLYFKEYMSYVNEFIESINRPKKIIFTGHSLGAALAALYNIHYTKSSESIIFACPNFLFNSKFSCSNSYSYRILKDFVTWIPFDLPFMNWSKSTKSIRVKSVKNYWNPIMYHSLENYIRSILRG